MFASLSPLQAQQTRSTEAPTLLIETQRYHYHAEKKRHTYEEVVLRYGDLTIIAPELIWDEEGGEEGAAGIFTVPAPLRFRYGSNHGTARSMRGDLRRLRFEEALLQDLESGLVLQAEILIYTLQEGVLEARGCRFSFCPPRIFARGGGWGLQSERLRQVAGEDGIARNAVLRLEGVPLFWSPYLRWPARGERRSGWLPPRIGTRSSETPRLHLGYRIAVPYFQTLGAQYDITLTPWQIETRGQALEVAYRYAPLPGTRGFVNIAWHPERRPRDPAFEIIPGTRPTLPAHALRRRFFVDTHHRQLPPQEDDPPYRFSVALSHSSDGQVRREYRLSARRPYRQYQIDATYQGVLRRTESPHEAERRMTYELGLSLAHYPSYRAESIYATRALDSDQAHQPALWPRLRFQWGHQGRYLQSELTLSWTRFVAEEAPSGRVLWLHPRWQRGFSLGDGWQIVPAWGWRLARYQLDASTVDEEAMASEGWLTIPCLSFDLQCLTAETLQKDIPRSEGSLELNRRLRASFPFSWGQREHALEHQIAMRLRWEWERDTVQPLPEYILPERLPRNLLALGLENAWSVPHVGAVRLVLEQRYDFRQQDVEPARLEGQNPDGETEIGEPLLPLVIAASLNYGGWRLERDSRYQHQLRVVVDRRWKLRRSFDNGSHIEVNARENERDYRTPRGVFVAEQRSFTLAGLLTWDERLSLNWELVGDDDLAPSLEQRYWIKRSARLTYAHPCYRVTLRYLEERTYPTDEDDAPRDITSDFQLRFFLLGFDF